MHRRPFALRLKKAAAWAICSAPVGRALGVLLGERIRCRGSIVDTSDPSITPEIKAMLFWRIYESAEMRFVNRYLRRDLDVIELGGSLGVVTCQIAGRLQPARRVITVEANPSLARLLARNLDLNGVAERVTIVNAAIDYNSKDGFVSLIVGSDNLRGSVGQNGELSVSATTLSDVATRVTTDEFALVSDIEGAEAGIALHEGELLKRCRQMIIENHTGMASGIVLTAEEIIARFTDVHGFKLRDRFGSVAVLER